MVAQNRVRQPIDKSSRNGCNGTSAHESRLRRRRASHDDAQVLMEPAVC